MASGETGPSIHVISTLLPSIDGANGIKRGTTTAERKGAVLGTTLKRRNCYIEPSKC